MVRIDDTPLRILLNYHGIEAGEIEILYRSVRSTRNEIMESRLTVYVEVKSIRSFPKLGENNEFHYHSRRNRLRVQYSHLILDASLTESDYNKAKSILTKILELYEKII